MDNFVREKLQEWNLSSLMDVLEGKYLVSFPSTNFSPEKPHQNCEASAATTLSFFPIENMIDKEAFLLLNEEALKEMISAVGPRLKLQKKLRELQVINYV